MDFDFKGGVFDDTARRKELADSIYNGIDYLEVDATPGETNQRILRVYFIAPGPAAASNKVTSMLDDLDGNTDAFIILGGTRVRNVRVLEAQRVEDHIELLVDRPGDFSDYTLRVVYPGGAFPLDVFYAEVTFNFKAGCPARFDCRQPLTYPPETPADLFVDYMAKDYDSFRQAMIDLLPKLIPNWTERRAADLGMTALELMAYVGDQLSYYQDAVANEAYLETSRQRISVRRHARLIDYQMHDGLSARTVIHIEISAGELVLAAQPDEDRIVRVITQVEGLNLPHVIPSDREDEALAATGTVFEIHLRRADPSVSRPVDALHMHHDLNELTLYNWRNQIASLPAGGTSADIVGDIKYDASVPGQDDLWRLKENDLLLFEEVFDPYTGERLLADPNRRHLVRLTKVETVVDELASELEGSPVTVTRVYWDTADALPFRIWISNVTDDGDSLEQVSVARGNLAIADYGRSFTEWYPREPEPGNDVGGIRVGSRAFRFRLQEGPLAHSVPLETLAERPASELRRTNSDPHQGVPAIHRIDSITKDASGAERRRFWQVAMPSLLDSDRFAEDVIVETDNAGRANLRFGSNEYGAVPDDNSFFEIRYRVGVGTQGNIGADKLAYIVQHDDVGAMTSIASVRNLLPAWGGSPPESMEEVKRLAPAAFRASIKRAVTEADYAQVTELHPRVERALAVFRWTGSWHTVFIRVDPKDTEEIDDELRQELVQWVSQFAMTGYDIEIIDPIYIPLEITIEICVEPGYFTGDVERTVLEVFSNRRLPDGGTGFFHPDNFTFGQRLYISKIYEAVEQVAGVQSATITGIHRQDATDPEGETRANLARGYISVGEFAVIRLDNSPNFPENGILQLIMLGGNI
jgi:hypothetical protein